MTEDLENRMKVDVSESSEMGEVVSEFSTNKPSSSNLTRDEHRLQWRAKGIFGKMSPSAVKLVDDFVDSKRSVDGWNTNQKVAAITGVQQQRNGIGERLAGLFKPKE